MRKLIFIALLFFSSFKVLAAGNLYHFTSNGKEVNINIVGSISNPDAISFTVDCAQTNCNDFEYNKQLMKGFVSAVLKKSIYSYKFVYLCPITDPNCSSMQSIKEPIDRQTIDTDIEGIKAYKVQNGITMTDGEQSLLILDTPDNSAPMNSRRQKVTEPSLGQNLINGISNKLVDKTVDSITNALFSDNNIASKFTIIKSENGQVISACLYENNTCIIYKDMTFVNHSNGDVSVEAKLPNTASGVTTEHILDLTMRSLGEDNNFQGAWKCIKTQTGTKHYMKVQMLCGYWP